LHSFRGMARKPQGVRFCRRLSDRQRVVGGHGFIMRTLAKNASRAKCLKARAAWLSR
jgi:hypothetical protein